MACHPTEACGPDATCVNRLDGQGYTCRCHLGKTGERCTEGERHRDTAGTILGHGDRVGTTPGKWGHGWDHPGDMGMGMGMEMEMGVEMEMENGDGDGDGDTGSEIRTSLERWAPWGWRLGSPPGDEGWGWMEG